MKAERTEAEIHGDAEKLADIFTILQRCFMLNLSKELSRGNVSFAQYFLMGYLCHENLMTMSQIAEKMGHTTAAATGLVDRLEKLEYVKRSHATQDRRKIMVEITSSGLALVNSVRADMVENLKKMMTVLKPEEQEMWVQIYEKIFTYCQNSKCKES